MVFGTSTSGNPITLPISLNTWSVVLAYSALAASTISPLPLSTAVKSLPRPALVTTLPFASLIFTMSAKLNSFPAAVLITAVLTISPAFVPSLKSTPLTFLPMPILAAAILTSPVALTLPKTLIVPSAFSGILSACIRFKAVLIFASAPESKVPCKPS